MSNLQITNSLTLDSREVAQMIKTEHSKLIRKLEGDSTHVGVIPTLTKAQMGVSDYFILSTYKDGSGKENKCYLFTKMGCEFIANKFNGEKGILFTAKYVKRFNEMESKTNSKGNMQIVSLIHKEVGELIAATTEIEDRVSKLEDEDFIKPYQKKALINARTKKVLSICGGKLSQAYQNRSFRSRVYQDIFRNIKNIYKVNEYDAIPKYKYDEALNLVNEYSLPLELKYDLEKINNQITLNEVACTK